MSKHAALAAVARLNMGVALLAPHCSTFVSDMQELAAAPLTVEPALVHRRSDDLCGAYGYGPSVREKPFAFRDGIAIIPVHGTLINRYSYGWSFVTGYSYIRAQMNAALDDDDVKTIVFDVNSYGGEAAGCFELAEEIREARSRKSLLAVVDSNCCSAAYAIASACSKVYVTPSGQAGSVGVIAMHMSMEKMLDQAGLEVTIISSFEHKADANPYKKLPDNVRADLAASVEKRANEFVSLVAKNRNLSEDLVRATESRTFRADEALERKLIDAVQPPSKAVSMFLAELGGETPNDEEDDTMTTQAKPEGASATPAAAAAASAAAAAASVIPAAEAAEAAMNAAVSKAVSEALTAERARASGIMGCEEAKGRQDLAQVCVNQGMSVEAAKQVLAAAPAPAAATGGKKDEGDGGNTFRQKMDTSNQPNVGEDGGDQNGGEDDQAQASKTHVSSILSHFGAPQK